MYTNIHTPAYNPKSQHFMKPKWDKGDNLLGLRSSKDRKARQAPHDYANSVGPYETPSHLMSHLNPNSLIDPFNLKY